MKLPFDELMARAQVAGPPQPSSRTSWAAYLPIVQVLMEQRAHSVRTSVRWLIQQGEIAPAKEPAAYRSIRQLLIRRQAARLRKTPSETSPHAPH